jgi:hypothetical protein
LETHEKTNQDDCHFENYNWQLHNIYVPFWSSSLQFFPPAAAASSSAILDMVKRQGLLSLVSVQHLFFAESVYS